MLSDSVSKLKDIVAQHDNIVFFGGAGVSTESGIPDFRSVDGLYNQQYKYPPETILSYPFFVSNTFEFYEFYRNKMIIKNVKPNPAHIKLAELEQQGKLKAVITQNIDGLHQAAGSKNVFELHGSIHRNYCMKCRKFYTLDFIANSADVPLCDCGGTIKPDVVLYSECLDSGILHDSTKLISRAQVLIVGGTSLGVYPAAQLINYYKGNNLILINKGQTPWDNRADLLINDSIGKVFSQI